MQCTNVRDDYKYLVFIRSQVYIAKNKYQSIVQG
jgi:hypothetical protein